MDESVLINNTYYSSTQIRPSLTQSGNF